MIEVLFENGEDSNVSGAEGCDMQARVRAQHIGCNVMSRASLPSVLLTDSWDTLDFVRRSSSILLTDSLQRVFVIAHFPVVRLSLIKHNPRVLATHVCAARSEY